MRKITFNTPKSKFDPNMGMLWILVTRLMDVPRHLRLKMVYMFESMLLDSGQGCAYFPVDEHDVLIPSDKTRLILRS